MTRDREEIDGRFFQVNRNLADGLDAIDVDQRVGILAHNASNFIDGKQHTGFVISEHHGNDSCVPAQRLTQIVQIDFALAINFQPRYFTSDLRQVFTEIADGFVLYASSDDVPPPRVLLKKAADGPIV